MSNSKNKTVSIRCPAETQYLSAIRVFVTDIAVSMGFFKDDIHKIELCVDEACANVIEHAYNDALSVNIHDSEYFIIDVTLTVSEDSLTITISDFGTGSKIGAHSGISKIEDYFNKPTPRGLGIYIINHFMDEVMFSFPPQKGTQVSMTKYLPQDMDNECV